MLHHRRKDEQTNTGRIKCFIAKRARKAHEDSNAMLSEITTENPNAVKEEDKPKKKKDKEDEKF